jgi:hypothetical protein
MTQIRIMKIFWMFFFPVGALFALICFLSWIFGPPASDTETEGRVDDSGNNEG